ncbi:uncharacterized protein VICG_00437, partial [Vittaforma corneae ATCC 50505]
FSFLVSFLSHLYFYNHNPLTFFALSSDKNSLRNKFILTCIRIFFVISNLFVIFSWARFQSLKKLSSIHMDENVLYFSGILILLCLAFCFTVSFFLSIFSRYFTVLCLFSPLLFTLLLYNNTNNFWIVVALVVSIFLSVVTIFDLLINGEDVYQKIGRVASIMWRNIIPVFAVIFVVSLFNAIMVYFSCFVFGYIKNKLIAVLIYSFIVAWLYGACSGIIKAFISSYIYSSLGDKNNRFTTAIYSVVSIIDSILYATFIPAVLECLITAVDLVSHYICDKSSNKKKSGAAISISAGQYIALMVLEGIRSFLIALKTAVEFYNEFLISYLAIFGGEFDQEALKESMKIRRTRSRQSTVLFIFLRIVLSVLACAALIGMLPFNTNLIFENFTGNLHLLIGPETQIDSTQAVSLYSSFQIYFSVIYFCLFVAINFISSYFNGLIAAMYFDHKQRSKSISMKMLSNTRDEKAIVEDKTKQAAQCAPAG